MPYKDKEQQKQYQREYQQKHRSSWPSRNELSLKKANLKSKYGLEWEEYVSMLAAQNFQCMICEISLPLGATKDHIDHDHSCCAGRKSCGSCIRGILCRECNIGLGLFKDSPALLAKAKKYLQRVVSG